VWSIPAVGVPAFVILGIGASIDRVRALPARAAVPAGVAAFLVGVFAFAPTWLSARLVDRAYDQPTAAAAANDLRWARRLDPLAVDPLIAESALAKPPETLPPLERALARQPRDSEMYFLLGRAYLDAGRKADARRVLLIARKLAPRNQTIQNVLREASE
jgi:Flp pilus assembly protein TadD